MKIVKTYNTVINEARNNLHLLNSDQIEWCNDHLRVEWYVNDNGEVFTHNGEVTIYNAPDQFKVKFADCSRFECLYNDRLTSLSGSPNRVEKVYKIYLCKNVESLHGGPSWVGGAYIVDGTRIETLEGAPEYVGSEFSISDNTKLVSLEGSPKTLDGIYYCTFNNNLKSTIGISQNIGKRVFITDCRSLVSLEGLNKNFDGDIIALDCGLPQEELIYNWQNDINQDEVDQFKQDWEI
jgi:hypothetical protein